MEDIHPDSYLQWKEHWRQSQKDKHYNFVILSIRMKDTDKNLFTSYSISGNLGLRRLLITSDSILLHRAAYGLRSTACCRANSLPRAAAFSKSALASSFWHASLRRRPLCTRAWQALRPVPPLREMAWSRSCRAPGTIKYADILYRGRLSF